MSETTIIRRNADGEFAASGPMSIGELLNHASAREANTLLELWAELQETADIERIVECYDKEACSFWGTLSEDLRGSEESIRDYFQRFLEGKRFKVVYLERETIVLSPEIVNVSGTYRFENVEDPSMPPISARFTFVIRKRGEGTWRFVTHHSSRMPENGFKLPDGMKR